LKIFWRRKVAEGTKISGVVVIIIVLLVGVFSIKEVYDFTSLVANNDQELHGIVSDGIQYDIQSDGRALKNALIPIMNDNRIINAFESRDREALLVFTLPMMNKFKEMGIEQFQFHLPDDTSFLRVNQPEKYGDDLSNSRKMVVEANKAKVELSGVEDGLSGVGFRYIVPLVSNGKHLGTVELGFAFNEIILAKFKQQFPGEWYFIGMQDNKTETIASTAKIPHQFN